VIVVEQIDELREAIDRLKSERPESIVGFVPTMGALHEGHLSLIEKAAQNSTIIVCSIFVNPTQFNDSKDLENYPRTIEEDKKKLLETACDILFLPNQKIMYPDGVKPYSIEFGGIEKMMEGKFRPGHFEGVAMVVERFFRIVQPDKAFFGLKDFQQLTIIRKMVEERSLDIEIIPVAIKRSEKGLALSSRNALLSDQQREDALVIYHSLLELMKNIKDGMELNAAKNLARLKIEASPLELEYLEVVRNADLKAVETPEEGISCCVAAYCGSVRLIDNMQLN
jgi:pantoate--beta-alanine ligase